MATEVPTGDHQRLTAVQALDALIGFTETACEELEDQLDTRKAELGGYLQARSLLSGDGTASPPSAGPELKPNDDDPPPPAQQLPSQAPAGAASTSSSPASAPDPARRPKSKEVGAANREKVLAVTRELCADGGTCSGPEIYERADLSKATAAGWLARLVIDGSVERHGKSRATRYSIPTSVEPATPAAERKQPGALVGGDRTGRGAAQEPSLEGKILAYLQLNSGATGPGIALGIGVSLNEVRPELGKLIRESEIRTHHKNGDVVYVPVG